MVCTPLLMVFFLMAEHEIKSLGHIPLALGGIPIGEMFLSADDEPLRRESLDVIDAPTRSLFKVPIVRAERIMCVRGIPYQDGLVARPVAQHAHELILSADDPSDLSRSRPAAGYER